jgi:hypothetical protein
MRVTALLILSLAMITGCASNQLSPEQIKLIEVRSLQGSYDDAYRATMQVMQDYGYIIKNTDMNSGTIYGETGKIQSWGGTMKWKEITATLEKFGDNNVRERITILAKSRTSSQYGTHDKSKRILDINEFNQIYEYIQKEIFVRENLNK